MAGGRKRSIKVVKFVNRNRAKHVPTLNCRRCRDGGRSPLPESVGAERGQNGGEDGGERADEGDDGGGQDAADIGE